MVEARAFHFLFFREKVKKYVRKVCMRSKTWQLTETKTGHIPLVKLTGAWKEELLEENRRARPARCLRKHKLDAMVGFFWWSRHKNSDQNSDLFHTMTTFEQPHHSNTMKKGQQT
jgi:hypothetical protein